MEDYKLQIAETVIIIFVFFISKLILKRIITKVGDRFNYQSGRMKMTNKIAEVLLLFIFITVLMVIWGVDQSRILVFLSTILTILGVAFFAQWSIISNITSTLIIFFNHQVNIGDRIVILDKDYHVEGKISDIGIFFIIIKVSNNEYVSIPSNVFMQKMVKKVKSNKEKKNLERQTVENPSAGTLD